MVAYDSMHRLKSVTYPMGAYASVTPSKTYVYDAATVNDHFAQYSLAEAAGYLANTRAFDQLSRQEGRLQRALDRARREILMLASTRPPEPPPEPAKPEAKPEPQAEVKPAADPAPTPAPTAPPSGFVPPKYPRNMPSFSGPQAKEHRRQWLRKNASANLA